MERKEIQVRPAVIADIDRLATVVFRETYGAAIAERVLGPYLARSFAPETFARLLCETRTMLFVATADGVIGGYGKLVAAPMPKETMPSSAVELSTLYIDRRYQGRGLGTALMNHALAWAAHQAYERMWLCVWQKNQQALAFYQRFGFVIVGEIEIVVDDVVFHDWVMHRSTTGSHTTVPSPAPASAEYF